MDNDTELNDTCTNCSAISGYEKTFMYVEVTIILLLGAASLVGNILLIVTFCKCRFLRTISNVLLVNLALTAILMSVIVIPLWAVTTVAKSALFGDAICKMAAMIASILFINSILTLAGIAMDRYFIICFPFKYQIHGTMGKVLTYTISSWVYAIIMSMPPWLKFGAYVFQPSLLPICMNDYYNQRNYTLVIFLTTFLPSFLLILLSYLQIFRICKQYKKY